MEENDDEREREEFERQLRGPSAVERWFASTPWWLVSAGIHAVVLLAAGLIYVERLMAVDNAEIVCGMRPPPPPPTFLNPPDHPGPETGLKQPEQGRASDEPSIFDPLAKTDIRNESTNDEPFQRRKGDSPNFLAATPGEAGGIGRQPGKIPGMHDKLGVGGGGGGGGSFGDQRGGRERLAGENGGGA